MPDPVWLPLRPPFTDKPAALDAFLTCACQVAAASDDDDLTVLRACLEQTLHADRQRLGASLQSVVLAVSILVDLAGQGWAVRACERTVYVLKPLPAPDRSREQARVRRALQVARHEQLREHPVRTFLRSMEQRRHGPHGWTSIQSLMRDGGDLADRLEKFSQNTTECDPLAALRGLIRPYLQVVTENARCEHTGLRLADIWRYFRHTWLTPSRSVPGRSMMILVRDAAVEPHPVLGIAAISSAIVQQSERDRAIGWDRDGVLREIAAAPTDAHAAWLLNSLEYALADFHTDDLVDVKDVARPGPDVIIRLNTLGQDEKAKHHLHARNLGYKQHQEHDHWDVLVQTHLYRGKRAHTLAALLAIRRSFQCAGFDTPTAACLAGAAASADFCQAVSRLVRRIKGVHVGINMMDISIAGAVAPYNALLGGKLVSLLLTGPEVRRAYAERYRNASSVIASGMKGHSVVRAPELVLLCTTGLFAGGSSQYNRVRLPGGLFGAPGEVRYHRLPTETEFATFHISQHTLAHMKVYAEQSDNPLRANGIFGEGVNPKMRNLSEGLKRIGFNPDVILRAGSPRAVYMIPLAHNYRDVLLGRASPPDYIIPDGPDATERIAEFWRSRWLLGRLSRPGVLDEVRRHSTHYPLRHGAAVTLPPDPGEDQLSWDDFHDHSSDAPDDGG